VPRQQDSKSKSAIKKCVWCLDFVRAVFNFQYSSLASGRVVFSSCGADPSRAKKRLSAPSARARAVCRLTCPLLLPNAKICTLYLLPVPRCAFVYVAVQWAALCFALVAHKARVINHKKEAADSRSPCGEARLPPCPAAIAVIPPTIC
jgi:hypothetical protein